MRWALFAAGVAALLLLWWLTKRPTETIFRGSPPAYQTDKKPVAPTSKGIVSEVYETVWGTTCGILTGGKGGKACGTFAKVGGQVGAGIETGAKATYNWVADGNLVSFDGITPEEYAAKYGPTAKPLGKPVGFR